MNYENIILYLVASSAAAFQIVNWIEWRKRIHFVGVLGLSVALSPLVFSAVSLISFIIIGQFSFLDISTVLNTLLVISALPLLFSTRSLKRYFTDRQEIIEVSFQSYLFSFIWLLAVSFLIFSSNNTFLTQNDSLEYLIAARELFYSPSLDSYPILNPETNISGFYGPWTHPPLYSILIAVSLMVDGNPNNPEAFRFLAPWFAISSSLFLLCLSNFIKSEYALISACSFLLLPLYFLGAESGLADSIVIYGFIGSIFILIFSKPNNLNFIFCAILTSHALLSHSQAIIYPIFFIFVSIILTGFNVKTLKYLALYIIVLFGISIYPYIRNFEIFGFLAGDSSAVFELEILQWKEHFSKERGIDTPIAKLEYGLFKGFTSLEAYGFIFWFSLAGFAGFGLRIFRKAKISNFKQSLLLHGSSSLIINLAVFISSYSFLSASGRFR